eukprot:6454195-Amphidinium_carterae.2
MSTLYRVAPALLSTSACKISGPPTGATIQLQVQDNVHSYGSSIHAVVATLLWTSYKDQIVYSLREQNQLSELENAAQTNVPQILKTCAAEWRDTMSSCNSA